jgi:hypothetical protein
MAVDRIHIYSVAWLSWGRMRESGNKSRYVIAAHKTSHEGRLPLWCRSGVSSPQSRAAGQLVGMAPNDGLWHCRVGTCTRPWTGIDSGWEVLPTV